MWIKLATVLAGILVAAGCAAIPQARSISEDTALGRPPGTGSPCVEMAGFPPANELDRQWWIPR